MLVVQRLAVEPNVFAIDPAASRIVVEPAASLIEPAAPLTRPMAIEDTCAPSSTTSLYIAKAFAAGGVGTPVDVLLLIAAYRFNWCCRS
jgi:hypothetical protein